MTTVTRKGILKVLLALAVSAAVALGLASPAQAQGRNQVFVGTNDGHLFQYYEANSGWWGAQMNTGSYDWNRTRIITTTSADSFLEVSNDGTLSEWAYNGGSGYNRTIQGGGWTVGNTYDIAGLDRNSFLEIRGDDWGLSLWTRPYVGGPWSERHINSNWGNTTAISGYAYGKFRQVTNRGEVKEWDFSQNLEPGTWGLEVYANGFTQDNTIDIVSLDYFSFVEQRADGGVSLWRWSNGGYVESELYGVGRPALIG